MASVDVFAELKRLGALIRQLQGALQGERRIRGTVSAAGAPVIGTGFTAAKNATGDYTVTFTTAFSGPPSVVVTAGVTGIMLAKLFSADPTATSFRVATYSLSPTASADCAFHFVAVGP